MKDNKLERGRRVLTPDGEGEILEIDDQQVRVKLNSGDEKTYTPDKVHDDSDAG